MHATLYWISNAHSALSGSQLWPPLALLSPPPPLLLLLLRAIMAGHLETMQRLIVGGAGVNHQCSNGYSPLLQVGARVGPEHSQCTATKECLSLSVVGLVNRQLGLVKSVEVGSRLNILASPSLTCCVSLRAGIQCQAAGHHIRAVQEWCHGRRSCQAC